MAKAQVTELRMAASALEQGEKAHPLTLSYWSVRLVKHRLQQKYVALNAEKKRELLEERSNIAVFHKYIQGIPIAERTAFRASDDYADHSNSMDEELRQLAQANNELGKRSRILTIPTRRLYGYNVSIYKEVALKFGISPVQVKNYLQKYRKFLRD